MMLGKFANVRCEVIYLDFFDDEGRFSDVCKCKIKVGQKYYTGLLELIE